jgi:hypothetical protein
MPYFIQSTVFTASSNSRGFTAVKALGNYFLSANVTWMVTTVPMLPSSHRYTYAILTLGLFADLASFWFAEHTPSLESGVGCY